MVDTLYRPPAPPPWPGLTAVNLASIKVPSGPLATTAAAGLHLPDNPRYLPVYFTAMAAYQLTYPDTQRTASSPALEVKGHPPV